MLTTVLWWLRGDKIGHVKKHLRTCFLLFLLAPLEYLYPKVHITFYFYFWLEQQTFPVYFSVRWLAGFGAFGNYHELVSCLHR